MVVSIIFFLTVFLFFCVENLARERSLMFREEEQTLSFECSSILFVPKAACRHASVNFGRNSIISVGGEYNRGTPSSIVSRYDAQIGKVSKLSNFCKPLSQHAISILDNHVYVCGGMDEGQSSKEVYRLNIMNRNMSLSLSKRWAAIEPMNVRRRGHASTVLHDSIYVFGGYDSCTAECLMRNNTTNVRTWHPIPSMDQERFEGAAVTVGDNIYVLGGYIRGTPTSSMIAFNTSLERWSEKPNMPVRLAGCAAVSYSKYIIVIGGYGGDSYTVSNECIVFDTEADTWIHNSNAHLIRPRYMHSANLLENGRLVIIGGRNESGNTMDTLEAIHVLGILPPDICQHEIRSFDDRGRLPIHIGAENGLRWDEGMSFLVREFQESLEMPSINGDIPIILAATCDATDLTLIFELFRTMLGLNYIDFDHS